MMPFAGFPGGHVTQVTIIRAFPLAGHRAAGIENVAAAALINLQEIAIRRLILEQDMILRGINRVGAVRPQGHPEFNRALIQMKVVGSEKLQMAGRSQRQAAAPFAARIGNILRS